MDIIFCVNHQHIEAGGDTYVVADSRNYLHAQFRFTDDWAEASKTAVFSHGEDTVHALLDEGDRCLVPWEVIKSPKFTVSVFGGNRITANRASVKVVPSGLMEGQPPHPPTPDAYDKILEKLSSKADGLRYENGRLQLLCEGTPVGNEVYIAGSEGDKGTPLYLQTFDPEDWIDRGIHRELLIPASNHNLGYNVVVMELVCQGENGWENILCQTVWLPNGSLSVQSDQAFAGRVVLKGV